MKRKKRRRQSYMGGATSMKRGVGGEGNSTGEGYRCNRRVVMATHGTKTAKRVDVARDHMTKKHTGMIAMTGDRTNGQEETRETGMRERREYDGRIERIVGKKTTRSEGRMRQRRPQWQKEVRIK